MRIAPAQAWRVSSNCSPEPSFCGAIVIEDQIHILVGFHNLQELSGATPRGRHSPITLVRLHLRRRRTGWSCRRNTVSTTERRINRMTRVSSMKNQSNFLATLKPMPSLVSAVLRLFHDWQSGSQISRNHRTRGPYRPTARPSNRGSRNSAPIHFTLPCISSSECVGLE
jgi:hypothetical protein